MAFLYNPSEPYGFSSVCGIPQANEIMDEFARFAEDANDRYDSDRTAEAVIDSKFLKSRGEIYEIFASLFQSTTEITTTARNSLSETLPPEIVKVIIKGASPEIEKVSHTKELRACILKLREKAHAAMLVHDSGPEMIFDRDGFGMLPTYYVSPFEGENYKYIGDSEWPGRALRGTSAVLLGAMFFGVTIIVPGIKGFYEVLIR